MHASAVATTFAILCLYYTNYKYDSKHSGQSLDCIKRFKLIEWVEWKGGVKYIMPIGL